MIITALRFPRPRHPLLRAIAAVAAIGLAAVLVVAGFFVLAVLAGVGLVVWALRRVFAAPAPIARASAPDVIDGEFVVLRDAREPRAKAG